VRQRRQLRLLQLLQVRQPQEFLVRVTTRSRRHRAWAFLAQSAALATILSLHLKVWVAQAAHAQPVAHLARAVQVAQVAHRVPVALLVQVVSQADLVRLVLASHAQVAVLQVARQAQHRVDSLAQVAAQAQAAVAVLAVEPLVLSVRAEPAVRARLASQSVQSAKSSNSAAMRHHLVALLYLAVTEPQFYVFVAVHLSKTSQTRLTPMQVS
jgi:hypothetical protein